MAKTRVGRVSGWIVLAINLLCVVLLFTTIYMYRSDYNEQLYEQNLNDITNLNHSSATIAQFFLQNQKQQLNNIAQYIKKTEMTYDQAVEYICNSNADQANSYQLIGKDQSGLFLKKDDTGAFVPVKYTHISYSDMKKIFTNAGETGTEEMSFTPEFSDNSNGVKSFALYTYVVIKADSGNEYYTLLSVMKSSSFIDMLQIEGGYEGMSSVMFNQNGNYIISNTDYKSSNFFDYIAAYNELSLDERNALAIKVLSGTSGVISYKNSTGIDCTYVYQRAPGYSWYSVTGVPLSSFHKTNSDFRMNIITIVVFALMLVADIAWFNVINRRLKISRDEEIKANNAKTDFLSRMSHDLRTPLNGIIGVSELAKDDIDSRELMAQHVSDINVTAHFMLGLVNDILDMSKIESGELTLLLKPYHHREIIRDVKTMFKPICVQKNIELVIDNGDDTDVCVLADRQRIKQIIFNLMSNAIKFTPSGGKVEFVIANRRIENDTVYTTAVIRDNGIGISRAFQEKMYDPFSQEDTKATASIQGTGLGLAITKSLIEIMGGSIVCESDAGQGTTFTIQLSFPVYHGGNAEDELGSAAQADFSELNGKRVLICEDNALNAQIAKRLLEKKGMTAELAVNGKLGLEMFSSSELYYYDAVIMDMRMPEMGGLEATRAIRQLNRADAKSISIIAMTANAFPEDVAETQAAGMNTHLAKPVEPEKLYETLAFYMHQTKK